MNFAIVCPSGYSSGGPEALHQLGSQINAFLQHQAFICYYPFDESGYSNETYSEYGVPFISKNAIDESWVVVLPEIYTHLADEFPGSFICLWWLSSDYGPRKDDKSVHLIDLHLSQSAYAMQRAILQFAVQPLMVSDYIHSEFCRDLEVQKTQSVAVNPIKGTSLIEHFEAINPDISVVRLESMTRNKLSRALGACGVYIDFGDHPGKDRIPREAAMRKCVVFTRRAGAAFFDEDVPLDSFYKFDSVEEVSEKLKTVFDDGIYQHIEKQNPYRQSIERQPDEFARQVASFIEFVCINK